jgi:hypothetical protein
MIPSLCGIWNYYQKGMKLVDLMVDLKGYYLADHSVEKLGHLLVALWEFQLAD